MQRGKDHLDFEAVKVLEDTVLKPEELRVETFTFPPPKTPEPSMSRRP